MKYFILVLSIQKNVMSGTLDSIKIKFDAHNFKKNTKNGEKNIQT